MKVVHVGFLFASPLCIKDKSVQGQQYTKNTHKDKIKEGLMKYYRKEGYTLEEAT